MEKEGERTKERLWKRVEDERRGERKGVAWLRTLVPHLCLIWLDYGRIAGLRVDGVRAHNLSE